ncbi:MAG TPA: class F sortase [Thermomicrobiales bacterium]|nr:class F sortase [Thermomicrobiales bacterium]
MTQQSTASLSRRRTLTAVTASAAAALVAVRANAQDDTSTNTPEGTPGIVPIQSTTLGPMPTTGAIRGAPVGTQPTGVVAITATQPSAIQVPTAQIDAKIEVLNIVNGVMENPTGPWVVSWYQQTAELGEIGNVVLAGHVDYWNVGPSVFYNVRNLAEGDEITLTGEDGETFTYAVQTNDTYGVQDLIGGKLSEVVSPTETAVLTMLTCGGEFDYVNGEYLSRTVVRAALKPAAPTA